MKHDGKHRMRAWIASATAAICMMPAASVFGADAPRSAPSRWEDVVKAAEKEGEVTVYATNSVGDLQVIWEAFKKKFPKIKLNATGISTTSEIVTKVMAERRAGQFLVDVMLGAPGATYNSFYRGKALDPMPPALVLPEVIDLPNGGKASTATSIPRINLFSSTKARSTARRFTPTRN
jgi:ABC-type glycerol-3-phosphate transport system substrate-binding protein